MTPRQGAVPRPRASGSGSRRRRPRLLQHPLREIHEGPHPRRQLVALRIDGVEAEAQARVGSKKRRGRPARPG